jgi:hypothetical protein
VNEPLATRGTRRDALGAGLLAGAAALSAAAAPALVGARDAFAQAPDTSVADSELLVGLIGFEQTAVVAYATAASAGWLGPTSAVPTLFGRQEQQHADALISGLKAIGGTPPPKPRVEDVPGLTEVSDGPGFLTFAVDLENQQLAAYLEANKTLGSGELLTLSSQIAAGEGRHLVVLRQSLGTDPIPAPLPSGSEHA